MQIRLQDTQSERKYNTRYLITYNKNTEVERVILKLKNIIKVRNLKFNTNLESILTAKIRLRVVGENIRRGYNISPSGQEMRYNFLQTGIEFEEAKRYMVR